MIDWLIDWLRIYWIIVDNWLIIDSWLIDDCFMIDWGLIAD